MATETKLNTTEHNRCLHCRMPQCTDACPIGNDIPEFLQLVRDGNLEQATELIGHPFGEICGYVCPHERQCQGSCVLAKRGHAVDIGSVEREVFATHPYKIERKVRSKSKYVGLKVAVVGGGVSGLTFATKMYEQGADVTIFERDELLSTLKLIPDFRLPREAIDRVLAEMQGKFTVVRHNVTEDDILRVVRPYYVSKRHKQQYKDVLQLDYDYDAVYVAAGASVLYTLGVEGEELATPYDVFLKSTNHIGNVVVIGGGNTAMDCARLAKRRGCNVSIAYRRSREDMPAFGKEIDGAISDGVDILYNVAPVKLVKQGEKLTLTLAKTVSEGRGKLTVTEQTHTVCCDTVVAALGSKADQDLVNYFMSQGNPKRPELTILLGGDVVGGKTVAEAVADGLKAAHTILKYYRKS